MRDAPLLFPLAAPHAARWRQVGFGFLVVAICWLMLIVGLIAGAALQRWVL
ncbi:hypothetical protein PSM7751_02691 [Pseudooceanicola marinus]|uniref:Uncharacterized protein n=1 Tax=Pseudooceanicola marinus TaxID=396013 RepID=A0A1X6ZM20_9RHOB|nr:hypothetical protein [Pseudooceanicola marinus]SLN55031.1 hypothetical protein PSM7751_02691 [Pseudooceanicola marinus]